MSHLKLVRSRNTRTSSTLSRKSIDTESTGLSELQLAKAKTVAARLAREFRAASVDYLVRRAWNEAHIPAYGNGILDPLFDRMLASVTYNGVFAHEQNRAAADVRQTLLRHAESLTALANKPLS
jgi:hypothetical protein